MSLTVFDLHNSMRKKTELRSKSFDKVFEICTNKILTASHKELLKIYFDVPEYVFGLPVYNINNCVKYLKEKLEINGFYVIYYFPKILYISWDLYEVNKTRNLEKLCVESSCSSEHLLLNKSDNLLLTSDAITRLDLSKKKCEERKNKMHHRPNGKFILNLD
jgi:hypothetical protein